MIFLFFLSGLVMAFNMSYLLPWLVQWFPMFWATLIALWLPLALIVTYVLYRWRKSQKKFREYFMIGTMDKKLFLIVLGIFFLVQALEITLAPTRDLLASIPGFQPPNTFPQVFMPGYEPDIPLTAFMGISLKGNHAMIFMWGLWLILNIGLEEFLWRGYALPRMEKKYGKHAWLVNGLCWNLVIHFFMRWSWITLMPLSLILPYLAQRTKSIWPGVILHGLGNFLFYLILIPSIFA